MNDFLEKLQQTWQAQCSNPIDVKPDQLLKLNRHERLLQLWVDIGMSAFFVCVGLLMMRWGFRDIQRYWPWLISASSVAWVAGYVLFNRWRRRRHAAHLAEPLLAHVEWSIKEIEHQAWLDGHSLWWLILPLALGCMIPPVVFFATDYSKRPLLDGLMPLLGSEILFAATFTYGYLIMKFGVRIASKKRREELLALRQLRESLLGTDE